jgi:hypothetical protein
MKILVIPDTQVRSDVDLEHLEACGNYIVDKKPDVIVHIGDHWDMPSVSSYSKKIEVEGKRIMHDIESGIDGMERLLKPIWEHNEKRKEQKKKQYKPTMHFCLGNHEERLKRYISDNPSLSGVLCYPEDFHLEDYGWTVHEFLKPVEVEGIQFAHYFYNPMSGRPYGGTAHSKLQKIKTSFVMGHQQGLDIATTTGNDGTKYWGIVAGSFYTHHEGYIGYQGNDHWRGLVMLHDVKDGDCNPCVIGMDYLMSKYGDVKNEDSILQSFNV